MSILKKLATGYLSPGEQVYKPDAEYKKAAQIASKCHEKLLGTLDESQKELLEQFLDARSGVSMLDEADYFAFAYRLATLVMIDVMSGVDDMVF